MHQKCTFWWLILIKLQWSHCIALLEFHEVINVFLVILKTTISMKFFKGGSNAVLQALKRNFQCYKSRPDHDSHWFQIEPKSFFSDMCTVCRWEDEDVSKSWNFLLNYDTLPLKFTASNCVTWLSSNPLFCLFSKNIHDTIFCFSFRNNNSTICSEKMEF